MMSGIICCACSILAISVLQFALIQWRSDLNKIQEKRVTAKSRPMMNLTARMPTIVSSSTSSSPEKRYHGKQDPWKSVVADDRSGQPDRLSSTNYSKLDDDRAWSSQEWKTEATTYDRSGRPDKTSWRMVRKVRPDHEEILLDGTAQSVRYGETLRDRSGRPENINSQEVAGPQNFAMGRDTTELELSVESRSFVNQVNDQVRKRQKRISNVAGDGEEHSMIWGMFMAVTMESAVFKGHTEANVLHIFEISGRTRRDLRFGNDWLGKTFMERSVINW